MLPFTEAAVVLAIVFVASPFYLRQAIASFESVDPNLVAAARTLGARPGRAFLRIALPLALSGLLAGWALAFARGIGEFGATLIFAGNIQAVTQTLPLAIYEQLEVELRRRARDGLPARGAQRRDPALDEDPDLVDALQIAIAKQLRHFRLDAELSVERETLALAGPSGAGKTTVLRAVAGLVSPDEGRIALGDARLVRPRRAASTCRRRSARSGSCSRSTRCSPT